MNDVAKTAVTDRKNNFVYWLVVGIGIVSSVTSIIIFFNAQQISDAISSKGIIPMAFDPVFSIPSLSLIVLVCGRFLKNFSKKNGFDSLQKIDFASLLIWAGSGILIFFVLYMVFGLYSFTHPQPWGID